MKWQHTMSCEYPEGCSCGATERNRQEAELHRLRSSACSTSSPWPMTDVLAKLCEAADILLDHKSYDGHGHELIDAARREAREYLKQELV